MTDIIEILPASAASFKVSGLELNADDNLILDAIALIRQYFEIPALSIHVRKQIPLGVGLGGGSSNATCTIKLLNSLFDLQLSRNQMLKYALELGSDCPFFVDNQPAIVKGRGEVLQGTNLDLSGIFLKLVPSKIHISTKMAFDNLDSNQTSKSINWTAISLDNIETLTNDFQAHAVSVHPEIGLALHDLKNEGAFYTSLTGTGSAVFGLFRTKPVDNQFVYQL